MAPSKSSLAKQAQLAKSREVLAEKRAALGSESVNADLWDRLQAANSRIEELELELTQKNSECITLHSDLEKSNQKCVQLMEEISYLKSKQKDTYHELRMQRQATKRGHDKVDRLEQQVCILKKAEIEASACHLSGSKQSDQALSMLKKDNEGLHSELSCSMARWASQLDKTRSKLEASNASLAALRKQVSSLRKVVNRAAGVKERAIAAVKSKMTKKHAVHHLMNKGVFTEDTRNIVRLLVKAGCSRNYINEVISAVLHSAGITSVGTISRPSIARILREGYFAAQIQLGYEMKNTKSMTFSADGTGHRSINYNSRHVHYEVEDYTSSANTAKQRATRFLGIQSSRDGSSEEAMIDWEKILKKISDIYNGSPFGKRSGSLLKFIDLLIKLVGMNTDHCSKEKKDARLLEELKAWAVNQKLGEDALLEMSIEEINQLYQKAENNMVKAVGGQRKWAALSEDVRAEKRAKMLEEVVAEVGEEAFEELPDEEKRLFRLFIWAGCGCHKDLNSVRGGYLAMTKYWNTMDLPGPVLLANRDNAPVVHERNTALEEGDIPTLAQERALDQSTRGAIKTAQLAGAIFNHKDDKKGHHDIFRYWWWEHVGTPFTFPDTSNNRFQSYCDAAAALILYSDVFIDFLEHLRINKQNSQLNHMEKNLWSALHCISTTTELAVLAIYAEAVSYPYMKAIRAAKDKEQNMLDLGPFHSRVYDHMHKIINNPDILIRKDSSYLTATLDGDEWQNSAVVEKIWDLAPTLPHFKDMLVIFFQGAADTWKRFTSEFAPGGLIDEATTEERHLAWMPATNDENEGALGSFRQLMRRQPQLTLLNHNALAMFYRNNTQAFMAAKFTEPEDYQYLRKLARECQGEEKERRKEIIEFRDKHQAEKIARKEKRERTVRENMERLATLDLILDKEKIPSLKGQQLKDQLKLFKQAGAPNLIEGRLPTLVNDIRQALLHAIDLHLAGEWVADSEGESETSDAGVDSDDGWEDIE